MSRFEIFRKYSRSQILNLCEGGQIVFSRHRERVFEFGEEAFYFGVVISGAYKLTRPSVSGEDVIVHFSTQGDVVAAFIMAQAHSKYPVSAISMGPSQFLKIPKINFQNTWKNDVDLILKIQNLLSSRMLMLQDQKAMSKAPLNQKIAALLISLIENETKVKKIELPLPITRKEIGDNIGATPESIIRVMSEWSKQGIIETNDQQIKILKIDKLFDFIKGNSGND